MGIFSRIKDKVKQYSRRVADRLSGVKWKAIEIWYGKPYVTEERLVRKYMEKSLRDIESYLSDVKKRMKESYATFKQQKKDYKRELKNLQKMVKMAKKRGEISPYQEDIQRYTELLSAIEKEEKRLKKELEDDKATISELQGYTKEVKESVKSYLYGPGKKIVRYTYNKKTGKLKREVLDIYDLVGREITNLKREKTKREKGLEELKEKNPSEYARRLKELLVIKKEISDIKEMVDSMYEGKLMVKEKLLKTQKYEPVEKAIKLKELREELGKLERIKERLEKMYFPKT